MRRSGPACGAKKATCRRSRWRSCRPSASASRFCLERRCRCRRRRSPRWRRRSSGPAFTSACGGSDGELRVWGTTRAIPAFVMVLEVAAPGLLVVKHHRGDGGKFVNVAVLEGDQIKIIDEQASQLPDCPAMLTSLLGFDSPGSTARSSERARRSGGLDARARARRDHPGGAVVRRRLARNRSCIRFRTRSIRRSPALADLVRRADEEHELRAWQEELEDLVEARRRPDGGRRRDDSHRSLRAAGDSARKSPGARARRWSKRRR